MTGYVGAFTAESYTLTLEASLRKSNGDLRSEVGRAQVTLYPVSTPVVSYLDGRSGDVIISEDIVLYTYCYDPDDPANVMDAFGYDYDCVRGYEGNDQLTVDDSSTRPCEELGTATDSMITLSADDLVTDVWYIYTFTCKKDEREHSSSIVFRPRSAESPIPTGTVVQLCGSTCPELHDPNQNLYLMVTDLAYDDTEIEWSCSVALTSDQVRDGDFNGRRLTILGESLPEVDSIDCVAALSRDGEDGESRITIKINSKPYCSSDDGCITKDLVSDSEDFPLAKYKLTGLDFADDQEDALTYSFGCYGDLDVREIYFKGTQSNYEVGGLSVGEHTCFVCCIDKYGSETCDTKVLEVTEPELGITEEVLNNVLDAVDTAVASGDMHALLPSVKAAESILGAAIVSEPDGLEEVSVSASAPAPESRRRRRLMSSSESADADALAESVITTLGDFSPFVSTDFTPAVTQLANLGDAVSYDSLITIASTLETGLDASFLDDTAYTAEEANQLTQDIATILTQMVEDWSSDYSALTTMQSYSSLLSYGEDLICMNVALGQSDAASFELDNGNGIIVACMKDQPSDLSGVSYTAGDVMVAFPSGFDTACGDECPSEIELKVSLTDNMNLHVGFLDTLVPVVGATSIETLSGVVNLEVTDLETDALCSDSGCTLTVTVPVSAFDASKTTACMRINGASAEGLDDSAGIAYVEDSYVEEEGTVQCDVTNLGEIFVVQFVALDVEDVLSEVEITDAVSETLTPDLPESETQVGRQPI